MPKKLTQAEFLAKAVAVHGSRYDYSRVVYRGGKQNVRIICSVHGEFEQSPGNHLSGRGCRRCATNLKPKLLSTEAFVKRARSTHGERYNYSASTYAGSHSRVTIGCPHGQFNQLAGAHMQGQGCPKCGNAAKNFARTSDTEKFIIRARAIHGTKYDYSSTLYKSSNSLLKISCPIHGLFEQRAYGHLSGKGCGLCSGPQSQNTRTFLTRAQAIHGQYYDYSAAEYRGVTFKIKISCPAHGLFEQLPSVHAKGHGCPKCARNRTNEAKRIDWISRAGGRAILYFLRIFDGGEVFFKIGITYLSVLRRYNKTGLNGYSYEILAQHTSPDAARIYDWEQSILETFAHLRYTPARPFGGTSECFTSANEILSIFPL